MSVPNQKLITTKRPAVYSSGTFITLPTEELESACRDLNPSAFIIWVKLASNANGYTDEFSPAFYVKHYGGCTKSYKTAWQELEDKRYIVPDGGRYIFYLTPQSLYAEPTRRIMSGGSGSISSMLV